MDPNIIEGEEEEENNDPPEDLTYFLGNPFLSDINVISSTSDEVYK
jgi:hypothetical protein